MTAKLFMSFENVFSWCRQLVGSRFRTRIIRVEGKDSDLCTTSTANPVLFFAGTFEDKEITHVEGEVDPIRDLDIINEELRLKDVEYFSKIYDELERKYVRGGEKKLKADYVRTFFSFGLEILL